MPKRDEELEFEYEDDEAEEGYDADDSDEEGYEDDDEYDDDDSEYDDEDEDDDSGSGGGWMRKALFALLGVVAIGSGVYAYFTGLLPFSPKPPEVVQSASPYANPNAFGKRHPSPGVPSLAKAQPGEASNSVAAKPEPAAPHAEAHAKANAAPAAPAPAAHVAAEPKPAPKVAVKAPVKPAVKPVPKPVAKPPAAVAAHPAPAGSGHYSVQCGAFASAGNANALVHSLTSRGLQAWVTGGSGTDSSAFSVRSTVVNSRARAEALKARFASAGHPGAVVPAGRHRFVIQLGIFGDRPHAEALASELKSKGMFVSIAGGKARMASPTRVYVGRYATQGQAAAAAWKIRKQGVPAIVVRV